MSQESITLAMTGASGAIYGLRLLECLLASEQRVNLLVSSPAQIVMAMETDLKIPAAAKEMQKFFTERYSARPDQLQVFGKEQWTAPVASGSGVSRAMVVCPCTSGTLAAIAGGTSDNLLERAADVVIKEQRKLVLVPREMPLSAKTGRSLEEIAQHKRKMKRKAKAERGTTKSKKLKLKRAKRR